MICMFASVSVNDAPVSGIAFALASVKVIVEVVLTVMLARLNAFAIVAGAAVTVRLAAFEGAPVGASVLATPLAVLACTPGISLVTTTVTVHEPSAGIVRPVADRLVWPWV